MLRPMRAIRSSQPESIRLAPGAGGGNHHYRIQEPGETHVTLVPKPAETAPLRTWVSGRQVEPVPFVKLKGANVYR